MKRVFLILSMIACLCFGVVADPVNVCATTSSATEITEDMYIQYGEGLLADITSMDDATIDSYVTSGTLPDGLVQGLESWRTEREELGAFVEIIESDVTVEDEVATIVVKAQFANREGTFTIVMTADGSDVSSAGFEKKLSVGEIFVNAALNTVIGMGTVFVVLIFISFIISLFKYIPAIQAKFTKKQEVSETAVVEEVEDFYEEELVDDGELVAVIMAAIYASMASEGKAVSKDTLVVRSIRRSRRK